MRLNIECADQKDALELKQFVDFLYTSYHTQQKFNDVIITYGKKFTPGGLPMSAEITIEYE